MDWHPFGDEGWEEPRDLGPRRADDEWDERAGDGFEGELAPGDWPLDPRALLPREQWLWYEHLWSDVCMLRERYRLVMRAGWWEDAVQVEALAALAAWVDRYDTGEWDDPPGKLALLYDLERINGLLRDGFDPFIPARDRGDFLRYLLASGCQPPPQGPPVG